MNPIKNKKDLETTIDEIRNFAYSYLEKYSPSKQQLKTHLFKKLIKKKQRLSSKKEIFNLIDSVISTLVDQDVYGFDSFQGLPESWHSEAKGSYSTKGVIPSVPQNVILHDGWFEETLPGFVEQHPEPVRFMNIDCDIYSSTKTVLECFAKQIIPGTVIVFDEYIGNSDWREDEFKAFQEAVLKYGWDYEYLCFSFMTKQVVVRIN